MVNIMHFFQLVQFNKLFVPKTFDIILLPYMKSLSIKSIG